MDIHVKRAYEAPSEEDGIRVLVDRLWPRGLAREKAHIDLWLKELAPSTELRKWFNHEPAKWETFRQRYLQELERQPEAMAHAIAAMGTGRVTLLSAAKEVRFNNAVALREFILARRRMH